MQIELNARPPFSLRAVVRSHGWAVLAPMQPRPDYDGVMTFDRLGSGRVIRLEIAPGSSDDAVQVLAEPGAGQRPLDAGEQAEVRRKVAWMLDLDRDLAPFYALAAAEPKLAAVVEGAQGRILRSPTLFEDVVKTILTTNTTWGGTKRMAAAFVERLGAPWPGDPAHRAFPTPAAVAGVGAEVLRQEVRLGYRAPYVHRLARAIEAGDLDLEALATTDLETPALRKRLLALAGIGPYAAANLLLMLGRTDYIPIDTAAYKVVSHEWHNGQPVSDADIESRFAHWGPWKALAFWFWDWSLFQEEAVGGEQVG